MDWILLVVALASLAVLLWLLRGVQRAGAGLAETLLPRLDEAQRRAGDQYQGALRDAIAQLVRQSGDADGRLRADLVEEIAKGIGETRAGLTDRLATSLREGREEMSRGLAATTQTLERKFAELLTATQERLTAIRGEVETKLGETVAANQKSFEGMATQLAALHESAGQMVELSKGVRDLSDVLRSPTARGAFGEMTLKQMLSDLFGDQTDLFETQFAIGNERVDAAIRVNEQWLCVDAKFPLENARRLMDASLPEAERGAAQKAFRRDVLAQAGSIRDLYIRPPLTMDVAFMFVPSEAIYQLLLSDGEIHQRMLAMHVVPTSPNSFYAYLRALAFALRGLKLERHAEEIRGQVARLGKEFADFTEGYRLVGKHLKNAARSYEDADQSIVQVRRAIEQIVRVEPGASTMPLLDRPAPQAPAA